jgi:hypothetical protein
MATTTVLPFEWDPMLAYTAIVTLLLLGLAIHQRCKWLQTLAYLGSMFMILLLSMHATGWLDGYFLGPDITHPLNRLAIGAVGSSIALLAWLPSVPAAVASAIERRPIEPLVSRLRMLVPVWLWAVISTIAFIDEPLDQLVFALGLGFLFAASSIRTIIRPNNNASRVDIAIAITLLLGVALSMPGLPLHMA